MDLFGTFVCASLTALGGGTVREIVLHGRPGYFIDYVYVLVVAIGVALVIALYSYFAATSRWLLVLDAVGLATFAFIGANRAAQAGYGLGAMMFCAALTAVGGGVLSDLMSGRAPQLFYGDFYAVP